MSISKTILSYLFLILGLILITGFIRDIWRLVHAEERLRNKEKELLRAQQDYQQLQDKSDYYKSDFFIESQIRDKLQMAKPGETVVILPEEFTQEASQEKNTNFINKETELANWQKWLKLFYK